jgi:hypothetical protein
MHPFTGLRQVRIAGAQRLNQRWLVFICYAHRNARANRIAIAFGTLQSKGNVSMIDVTFGAVDRRVPHQAQPRPGAVPQPYIEVAVLVPIGDSERAAIIGKI